jgi:predicted Holliday junction resolvase-like endonuclease
MSLVKQALILEIKDVAAKSVDLKSKMDTAKTELKRNLYRKKLIKNNQEAAQLFEALSRLPEVEAVIKVEDGVKDEVPVLEGRTQEKSGGSQTVE